MCLKIVASHAMLVYGCLWMFGFPWVTPASMIPWYIDSCSVSLDSDRYKSNCTVSPGFFSALSILNTVLWALNSGLKRSFKSTWIVSGCSWLYLMQSFLGRKQVMQNICLQVFFHPRCINHQGFLGTETGHQRTHFERNPMGIPTGRHLVGFPWINEVELFHPTVADLPFGSCERCSKGFQSVASAGVTLFQQIVAGDPVKMVPCCQMRLPWILGFNFFLLLQWWWT